MLDTLAFNFQKQKSMGIQSDFMVSALPLTGYAGVGEEYYVCTPNRAGLRLGVRNWITLLAVGILITLQGVGAQAADAHTVLAAQRERIETADYRATGHLVRVDADGKRISLPISIKAHGFPGVLRVIIEIGQPKNGCADQCAHILLEMRTNGQNAIKI
jgi:hypothetical protein